MGKVIYWEWSTKLKLDPTDKWYLHNPESFLENKTNRLFWDSEIQTDHPILARGRVPLLLVANYDIVVRTPVIELHSFSG